MYDAQTRAVVVRQAFAEHGLPPFTAPKKLARAEGFRVWTTPSTPLRCGANEGDDLLIPVLPEAAEQALVVQHERSHGWWCRRGDNDATEADAWLLTVEFVTPRASLAPIARGPHPLATLEEHQPHAPSWFLRLCLERYYRSLQLDFSRILGPEPFYR